MTPGKRSDDGTSRLGRMAVALKEILPTIDPTKFYRFPSLAGSFMMMLRGDLVLRKAEILIAWAEARESGDEAAERVTEARYFDFEAAHRPKRVIACVRIGTRVDDVPIPAGYQTADCHGCGKPVWASPITIRIAEAGAKVVCEVCYKAMETLP